MIVDKPESHFIFVFHPKIFEGKKYTVYEGRELTNGDVLQYWGKWIFLGERPQLDELARKLDRYVEEEAIPCIKYDRNPSANLGLAEAVMMVYCDRRKSEEVWQILRQHGIRIKAWVSERETMEMWKPGGVLLERWITSMNLDPEEARATREDAGTRLGYIFDHPDEIFSPWPQ
ncbi:MAG: hypothetical protein CO012_03200 [Syntrophobacterales bacterium CG_4_8_14_3_um_filter_49_14]|nr:MAG: hypothetical protein CO012_03200 [Syntrophobacterales bacterium CG_4_8_14_3_um_filter_49_14]